MDYLPSFVYNRPITTAFVIYWVVITFCLGLAYYGAMPMHLGSYLDERSFKVKPSTLKYIQSLRKSKRK